MLLRLEHFLKILVEVGHKLELLVCTGAIVEGLANEGVHHGRCLSLPFIG